MWRKVIPTCGSCCTGVRWRAIVRGGVAPGRKTQRFLSTTSSFCNKDDEPVSDVNKNASPNPKRTQDAAKNLLKMIKEMKVDIRTAKKVQILKSQKIQKQTKDFSEGMERISSKFQKVTVNQPKSNTAVNPELVEAASAVASSLPFDRKTTTSELLQILKKHNDLVDARKNTKSTDVSQIVANMRVRKEQPTRDASRLSKKSLLDDDEDKYKIIKGISHPKRKRGLYSERRLNIFTPASEREGASQIEGALQTVPPPTLWDLELAKEIENVYRQPPENAFEEMIQWTKEGKLWEFPINNEAGLVDDAEFHEHIILDKYLDDFPKEGPIRHFMELVTCGLSKNPYLSVKEKVDHIHWFRDYFKEKEELLKEIEEHEKEVLAKSESLLK